jgi:hypothetical protein
MKLSRTSLENALIGLAVVLVLGCTAAVAVGRAPAPSIASLVAEPAPAAGYRAVVLFQIADCRSGMGFLRAFQDPALRGLPLQGWMIGAAEDVAYARRRLAGDGTPMPVRVADRRVGRTVRQLGYDRTPLVVVLDPAGRVQLVAGRPETRADEQRLRAQLATFVQPSLP